MNMVNKIVFFSKRFDMLGLCLVPSYSLALGQKPFIAL